MERYTFYSTHSGYRDESIGIMNILHKRSRLRLLWKLSLSIGQNALDIEFISLTRWYFFVAPDMIILNPYSTTYYLNVL